jgi:hypothetical protein
MPTQRYCTAGSRCFLPFAAKPNEQPFSGAAVPIARAADFDPSVRWIETERQLGRIFPYPLSAPRAEVDEGIKLA